MSKDAHATSKTVCKGILQQRVVFPTCHIFSLSDYSGRVLSHHQMALPQEPGIFDPVSQAPEGRKIVARGKARGTRDAAPESRPPPPPSPGGAAETHHPEYVLTKKHGDHRERKILSQRNRVDPPVNFSLLSLIPCEFFLFLRISYHPSDGLNHPPVLLTTNGHPRHPLLDSSLCLRDLVVKPHFPGDF
jgi:hypothetical protein